MSAASPSLPLYYIGYICLRQCSTKQSQFIVVWWPGSICNAFKTYNLNTKKVWTNKGVAQTDRLLSIYYHQGTNNYQVININNNYVVWTIETHDGLNMQYNQWYKERFVEHSLYDKAYIAIIYRILYTAI